MPPQQPDVSADLDKVIQHKAEDIDNYTKRKGDFSRRRKLPIDKLLKIILNMEGNNLNAELIKALPDFEERVTASAFEQAKDKLCPEIFSDILQEFNQTIQHEKLLDGRYRIFAIDGSDFATPFNPDSEFLYTKTSTNHFTGRLNSPYCMVHANLLYDLINCTYQDCIFQPKAQFHERRAAQELINQIDNSNPFIVIMDRGYEGLNLFETLNRIPNCFYVIRLKTGDTSLREVKDLPDRVVDDTITFQVTTSRHYHHEAQKENRIIHFIHPLF